MADDSMTGSYSVAFPQDLLAEASRVRSSAKKDKLNVEQWRTSWLSRLAEKLVGRD